MILKFLNYQILHRYKTAYLWKIALKKKFPTHLSTTLKNQGLNIPMRHRTRSVFKNCAFIPKVNTDIYEKKSVKYQCIDTWNKYEAIQDRSSKENQMCKEISNRKLFEILEIREITFQYIPYFPPLLFPPLYSFFFFQ